MGRYKNGVNGSFSGKIGNVVGATCRGVDYIRSLPELSGKKATEKQQNQRALLGLVSSWLQPLKALIWTGYQMFNGTKTPMNVCVSFHLKEAITGNSAADYTIDFAKAVFSRGELLVSLVKEITVLLNGMLSIKWDSPSSSAFCKDNDELTIITYNPDKQEFVTFEGVAERGDKEVDLILPANSGGNIIHIWMHYVNIAGNAVSTTTYLGKITGTT